MYVHVHAWCVCACMVCMCMHSSACTSVVCVFVHNCRVGSETNNHAGSNPGFVCNTYRNVTTAAHVHDHEVVMELECRTEDDSQRQQRKADRHTCRHNLICAYISQPLIVAASDSIAALISWLIYERSNTVEHRMIPGGSNDKRLTDLDTCNCYIICIMQCP